MHSKDPNTLSLVKRSVMGAQHCRFVLWNQDKVRHLEDPAAALEMRPQRCQYEYDPPARSGA